MTEEQKAFAKDLADRCETRDQWLTVINFGRAQLLSDRMFLLRLIVDRAEFESKRCPSPVGFIVQDLCKKLQLTIQSYSIDPPDELVKR